VIKIPAQLSRFNPKVDRSMSIGFNTSTEYDDELLLEVNRCIGSEGWLIYVENKVEEVEIPNVDADLQNKSKAQRLRNSLYVQLQQKLGRKPSEKEWHDYYDRSMEAIIYKVKQTLE
jgi:hypothetical protein